MREPFEVWAPKEIARLRQSADALEVALRAYVAVRPDETVGAPTQAMASGLVAGKSATKTDAPASDGGTRKYGAVIEALEKSAQFGMSLSEMEAVLPKDEVNRNALRSFAWNQKRLGRFALSGTRYVLAKFAPVPTPGVGGGNPDVTASGNASPVD